jgi:RHS repeat-associated protein
MHVQRLRLPHVRRGHLTPLGYDAQYTSSDTGLIYLRARVYDPATGQFLSRDPLASVTRAPYNYALDNPVNLGDPSGYDAVPLPIAACAEDPVACALVGAGAGIGSIIYGKAATEHVIQSIIGEETNGDEGEAELVKRQEAERANCGDPTKPPGPGWEWKGSGPEGSNQGAWVNPETGETLHPDLGHGEPIGRHYDYTAPDGSKFRIYPEGRIEPNP